ncbi:MAG TPA: SDR family NAD(P)-dependent oxidoreductase [Polyangiaceae bacterium]|jgi:short-subunit dehydrogenase|nr:SDR family NAD(P)-dependent oxidoreductase [Polyangiaceae bacterium]
MALRVLITGASSGIGAALAREYDKRGAQIAILARRKDRLEALARELKDARAITCDVTEDASVQQAVREALATFGDLDVVIANAGIGLMGTVEELSIDDYRRQFETNVFGVLRTVKACIGTLKRTSGRIGLLGSVSGFLSLPGTSAYAMSKFAVRALAEALGAELANDGVSVTHVAPGFVESEIRKVDNTGKLHEERRDPIPPMLIMSNERAAHEIATAVQGRRPEVVVTNHGKAAMFVATRFPRTVHSVVRLASAQVMSRVKSSG